MIRAEGLSRNYGPLRAVDDISFTVRPGEVLGFLGPNGAGKTTTMRMLAGFVPASAGYAEICGFRIDSQPLEAKRLLGYLPEGAPSYGEMAPGEFLQFIGRIRGLSGAALRSRIDEVCARLQLGPVLKQPIETLSKGFRRRVGLAQTILHDPPVLILDEPTDGLDPNQKHEVRELINAMAARKIIVISTHILEEVDAVCTRAIIIARGRIVADETPETLIHRSRYHNAVTIRLAHSADLAAVTDDLRRLAEVDHTEVDEHEYSVTAFPKSGAALLTVIGDLAGARRWPMENLRLEAGRLDEVFRSITTDEAA
ncbi:MAG: ABC transporter ATP-binding protein [Chromatiales bacterium]|nr:ABC transporter ATP-binding protein [Chromatiales bacterium]